jgi:hypothetical protein
MLEKAQIRKIVKAAAIIVKLKGSLPKAADCGPGRGPAAIFRSSFGPWKIPDRSNDDGDDQQ